MEAELPCELFCLPVGWLVRRRRSNVSLLLISKKGRKATLPWYSYRSTCFNNDQIRHPWEDLQ